MADPFTIATLGGQAIGTIASLFRPKPKFPKLGTGRLRGLASARLATGLAQKQSNIRQLGAAGRLPRGAIASALAGAKQEQIDPNLDLAVQQAEQFNIGQRTRESLASQQRFDDLLGFNMEGLGTLAKIALLRRYGLFDRPELENQGIGVGANILSPGFRFGGIR